MYGWFSDTQRAKSRENCFHSCRLANFTNILIYVLLLLLQRESDSRTIGIQIEISFCLVFVQLVALHLLLLYTVDRVGLCSLFIEIKTLLPLSVENRKWFDVILFDLNLICYFALRNDSFLARAFPAYISI